MSFSRLSEPIYSQIQYTKIASFLTIYTNYNRGMASQSSRFLNYGSCRWLELGLDKDSSESEPIFSKSGNQLVGSVTDSGPPLDH